MGSAELHVISKIEHFGATPFAKGDVGNCVWRQRETVRFWGIFDYFSGICWNTQKIEYQNRENDSLWFFIIFEMNGVKIRHFYPKK